MNTINQNLINAVDLLNKLAKRDGYQNGKDFARLANEKKIINGFDAAFIKYLIDLRNCLCHGEMTDKQLVSEDDIYRLLRIIESSFKV